MRALFHYTSCFENINKTKTLYRRVQGLFYSTLLMSIIFCAGIQSARAHGGVSMDLDKCKLGVLSYSMHFSSYLPDSFGGEEFCWDIPSTGSVYLAFDFINAELRTKEIAFRLLKRPPCCVDTPPDIIANIPYDKHRSGNMHIGTNLEKGRYEGVFSVRENNHVHEAKIFINVGQEQKNKQLYFAILVLGIVGLIAFFFSRRKRNY